MKDRVQVGDVVLIDGRDAFWNGCLLVVEEIKPWGVVGSVHAPKQSEYPLRVAYEDIQSIYRKIEVLQ